MKIGFIIPEHYSSGGSLYIRRLINALQTQGVNITLLEYPLNKYGITLKKPHVNFKKLTDCDVLHLSSRHAFFFKQIKKKKVATLYHLPFGNWNPKYTNFAQRFYYKLFLKGYIKKSLNIVDRAVAISDYTKQSAIKIFGVCNIKTIYPGIDTEKYKPQKRRRPDGKIRLFFAGNLIKRKGVDSLPPIMDRLGNNYILRYTGGLRTKKVFRQKNMFPLGKLSEAGLIKEYNKCDILLFPSRLEGFGYVVAEAMSCEKPVVCTNSSSLPELIVDSKGGFLCEMDNVDDFVEKIKILATDKSLREKMGKFNRKRVLEKFTLERMAKEYLKLYQQLIKEA